MDGQAYGRIDWRFRPPLFANDGRLAQRDCSFRTALIDEPVESILRPRRRRQLRATTDYEADLRQQDGYLHAGIITTIADSACGYAAYTLMPAGSNVLSVEFKLNLLRPAQGETFVARAEVIKAGKTLTVVRADVFAMNESEERRLVATMQGTMICM